MIPNTHNRRPANRSETLALSEIKAHTSTLNNKAQVSAWMRLFAKVDSILLGKRIGVTAETIQHPAQTDGSSIVFNDLWIETRVLRPLQRGATPDAKRAVAMLKGINYHELAHVLFSPSRTASPYSAALQDACRDHAKISYIAEVFIPANMIEDQRIEMLFSALYPGSKMYFRASTLNGVLKNEDGTPSEAAIAFLFSHGRIYLPTSLRRAHRVAAEARFGSALCQAWADMIDEYIVLTLGDADARRAADLTIEATLVLRAMGVTPPANDHPGMPGTSSTSQPTIDEKKKAAAASAKAKQELEEQKEKDEAEKDATPAPAPTPIPDEGDDEGDDEGGADGASEPADDEADDDGEEPAAGKGKASEDNDGDGDPDSEDGAGAGTGGGFSDSDDSGDEPKNAQDAMEDLMNDPQFDRELNQLLSEFHTESEKGDIEKPKKNRTGTRTVPTPEQNGTVNRLFKVLQQMRSDAGDSWERRIEHGKVNLTDFMTRNPWELDFFEHHEEGRDDEFNMEVVILLDMSPSMAYLAERASLALWQIKSVMQRFDVPVTAYGYNDNAAKVLYSPADRVSSTSFENFGASGYGTDPLDALNRAYNVLSRSKATRRILFTITDGEWNGNTRYASDAVVQKINGLRGATSIIIGLTSTPGDLLRANDKSSYHCHQMGKEVTDPVQILDVFKDYVYQIGRKAASLH
ncbi:vWFA domain containing protein [uncultured Caudovirales phage]|uniref:VWFA domain containing protein n=1 Tax=uncultured Caudovirales phage TaxID=2100421 RepID=A0A6J5RLD1_9CAUD|nr:vWFA domain containing protein [uncultured Caudovirales phage]